MTPSMPGHPAPLGARAACHQRYLKALTLAFALFNSARLASCVPTLWAIQASADSSQHSLWTWCCWCGANLTMAAWNHEHNQRRLDRVTLLNACNALMCAATIVLIVYHRVA